MCPFYCLLDTGCPNKEWSHVSFACYLRIKLKWDPFCGKIYILFSRCHTNFTVIAHIIDINNTSNTCSRGIIVLYNKYFLREPRLYTTCFGGRLL